MKALSLFTFLFIITMSCAALTVDSDRARIVVEHWPPWEIALDKERKNVSSGVAIDLLNELFNRLNIKMELITVIWPRALLKIKTGEADLIPMVTITDERKRFMVFTDPVYFDSFLFAYSTDKLSNFQWQGWKDLVPYTIGATRGYHYSSDWKKAVNEYSLKINYNKNDISHLKMLLLGRIDIAPLLYSNAVGSMSSLPGHEKIRFSKKALSRIPLQLGISKKSFLAPKINKINTILKEMKKDGSYKRILNDLYLE